MSSQGKKQIASLITREDMLSFQTMATMNVAMSRSLMSDHFTSTLSVHDDLLFEITKLFYNSKVFLDYMSELVEQKKPGKDGLIPVYVEELAAITKCVLSIVGSKEELSTYGVCLDKQ